MKVGGSGRTNAASGSKGGKSSQKSGAKFSVDSDPVESPASSGVSSSSPISSIEALVALQGVEEELPRNNRQAVAKGEELLQQLEEIRDGLLTGSLSVGKLQQLKNTLSGYKIDAADPKLQEIIKDIEVRAAVELAKFGY